MTRRNACDGSRQIRSVLNRTKPARRSSVAKKARTVAELLQVPVELLCEIAGYLKPEDLLKLARTCKALRQRFMNRDSAVIWRRARRNVSGLPEPPSYLSEPAYAFFMFERRCYGCYRSLATQSIDKTFWRLAKRYCSACRKKM
ncbi:hypothetical protein OH76DRAFT_704196 [Lentinus brumalis]|uniref:F-box domain-containing protein n=1 Tax=Lentinus brumalis TaxID=2498619 RepID=A0A371D5S8_9APHY|nr:hypothetical protein OH76DRAFT_704196 [Polyporus brumalis]